MKIKNNKNIFSLLASGHKFYITKFLLEIKLYFDKFDDLQASYASVSHFVLNNKLNVVDNNIVFNFQVKN